MSKNRTGYIYLSILAVMLLLFFTNYPRIYGDINGVPYNLFSVLRTLPFFFVGVMLGMNYRSLTIPYYLRKHWFVLTLGFIPLLYPAFSPINSADKANYQRQKTLSKFAKLSLILRDDQHKMVKRKLSFRVLAV